MKEDAMKTAVTAVLLAALAFVPAGFALAADEEGLVCPLDKETAQKMMDDEHARRMEYYNGLLKLTPEQSKRISALMTEYRDRQLAEKDRFIASQVNAVNESDRRLKALLTPEQRQKYIEEQKKQNKSLSDKMRDWFQSGMCY
jgi:Spy/CpxP family protein refolding chaperone